MSHDFSRHEILSAAFLIDGYFFPSPTSGDCGFDKAKRECLAHLARTAACVESLTKQQMSEATGKQIR